MSGNTPPSKHTRVTVNTSVSVRLISAFSMTAEEKDSMMAYLASGGKVVATGPCALDCCANSRDISNQVDCKPLAFFSSIRNGV